VDAVAFRMVPLFLGGSLEDDWGFDRDL